MSAWTYSLTGRAGARPWRDAAAGAKDGGYGGPADGDFARYVDQWMAEAEAQARARPVAPRPSSPALKALLWRKLFPWTLWRVLAVAVFFWQAAAL